MKKILLAIIMLSSSCNETISQPPPNIVIILADDQGWGDLSMHGNTNLQTPNIDLMAQNGATFSKFYVSPVCSPTRAELLTGRYHVRTGVYSTSEGGERFNADEVTIADILQNAGYATGAYGKWHNGMQAPYHPNSRGFEEFYGFASGHWGNYFSPMLEYNGEITKGEGYLPDDLTNHAISFIKSNREQPFFLYLPLNTPHSPMQVPDAFWNKQADKTLEMFNYDKSKEDTLFTKAALAMVENIDYNVGRLVDEISALNLDSNTVIVYLSDNGPNGDRWNGGMKGKKGSTDEGGIRAPMIVKWTGQIEAGIRYDHVSSAVDILPTILDIADLKSDGKKPLDGVSLFDPQENRVIYTNWKGQCSLRSDRFRLDHMNKLYEVNIDPGQTTDVSLKYVEKYEELTLLKRKWLSESEPITKETDDRPFAIGHPSMNTYQLPARDAKYSGGVIRSNRWPNCSFLTNWTTEEDEIYWDIEVLQEGDYEVEMYYTCSKEDIGSIATLTYEKNSIQSLINVENDPPLLGAENDRYPRGESYVKDFKPMNLGTLKMSNGKGRLSLKAKDIKGPNVADFRLLMLKRV